MGRSFPAQCCEFAIDLTVATFLEAVLGIEGIGGPRILTLRTGWDQGAGSSSQFSAIDKKSRQLRLRHPTEPEQVFRRS